MISAQNAPTETGMWFFRSASMAGSYQPHGQGCGLEKIPRRHAGPEEHDPGIGRPARGARPILHRLRSRKHRFVDRGTLAVVCDDALQFVPLWDPPSGVIL